MSAVAAERFRLPCNEHLVGRCYDVANAISELDSVRGIVERVEAGQNATTIYLLRAPHMPGMTTHIYSRRVNGDLQRYGRARFKGCDLEWPL